MSSGDTEPLHLFGEHSKDLGAFLDFKTSFSEEGKFAVVGRNGRCEDHEGGLGTAASIGDESGVVFKVEHRALLLQFCGERCRGAVVACHAKSLRKEIAHECAHAYSSCPYEIYGLNALHFSIT